MSPDSANKCTTVLLAATAAMFVSLLTASCLSLMRDRMPSVEGLTASVADQSLQQRFHEFQPNPVTSSQSAPRQPGHADDTSIEHRRHESRVGRGRHDGLKNAAVSSTVDDVADSDASDRNHYRLSVRQASHHSERTYSPTASGFEVSGSSGAGRFEAGNVVTVTSHASDSVHPGTPQVYVPVTVNVHNGELISELLKHRRVSESVSEAADAAGQERVFSYIVHDDIHRSVSTRIDSTESERQHVASSVSIPTVPTSSRAVNQASHESTKNSRTTVSPSFARLSARTQTAEEKPAEPVRTSAVASGQSSLSRLPAKQVSSARANPASAGSGAVVQSVPPSDRSDIPDAFLEFSDAAPLIRHRAAVTQTEVEVPELDFDSFEPADKTDDFATPNEFATEPASDSADEPDDWDWNVQSRSSDSKDNTTASLQQDEPVIRQVVFEETSADQNWFVAIDLTTEEQTKLRHRAVSNDHPGQLPVLPMIAAVSDSPSGSDETGDDFSDDELVDLPGFFNGYNRTLASAGASVPSRADTLRSQLARLGGDRPLRDLPPENLFAVRRPDVRLAHFDSEPDGTSHSQVRKVNQQAADEDEFLFDALILNDNRRAASAANAADPRPNQPSPANVSEELPDLDAFKTPVRRERSAFAPRQPEDRSFAEIPSFPELPAAPEMPIENRPAPFGVDDTVMQDYADQFREPLDVPQTDRSPAMANRLTEEFSDKPAPLQVPPVPPSLEAPPVPPARDPSPSRSSTGTARSQGTPFSENVPLPSPESAARVQRYEDAVRQRQYGPSAEISCTSEGCAEESKRDYLSPFSLTLRRMNKQVARLTGQTPGAEKSSRPPEQSGMIARPERSHPQKPEPHSFVLPDTNDHSFAQPVHPWETCESCEQDSALQLPWLARPEWLKNPPRIDPVGAVEDSVLVHRVMSTVRFAGKPKVVR